MKPYGNNVLVRAALTEYHRLGGLNSTHLFLTVLEAERSKIKVLADVESAESPLLGLQLAAFSLCPPVAERKTSTVISSYKGTNPTMRTLPL